MSTLARQALISVLGGLLLAAPALQADDKAEAQRHFKAGKSLMKVEDFAAAAAEFEASIALYPTRNGLFNLVNCLKALHRYGEALAALRRLNAEFGEDMDEAMRERSKELTAEILAVVANLEIRVSEPGAAVSVDGSEVGSSPLEGPLVIGPGKHEVRAELDGFEPATREVSLLSGETATAELVLEPVPPAAPAPATHDPAPADDGAAVSTDDAEKKLSPLFWVLGGATILVGGVTGGMWGAAGSSYDDYQERAQLYSDGQIPRDDKRLLAARDDTEKFGNLAVGFGIGAGVLAAGTIVVLIIDLTGDDSENETAALRPTPAGLSLGF